MENSRAVLRQAIETYGAESQLDIAIEEFSELIKEICKHKRHVDNTEAIIEEMADCYIMLEQMKTIFGLCSTVIRDVADKKIERLRSLLATHSAEKGGEEQTINRGSYTKNKQYDWLQLTSLKANKIEVIGNTHDNIELLKGNVE